MFFNSYTPEEFQAQDSLPLKNSKQQQISSLKPFTLKEIQAQNTLALKNSKLITLYP